MHHCHSFSRFSRPYRPVIIDMCVSLAFARVGQPIAWSLGTSDGASRSLGKMSSSSNSVADCSSWPDARYARARCHCSHLIPPCDSCANHRLGRHAVCCRDCDCRHIGTCTRPVPLPCADRPDSARRQHLLHMLAQFMVTCESRRAARAPVHLDPCGHRVHPLLRSGARACRVSCSSCIRNCGRIIVLEPAAAGAWP